MACRNFALNLLARYPSQLSRLVFLGSRRDPATGRYRDDILAGTFGVETAHLALEEIHLETFHRWMGMSQPEQMLDGMRHFEGGQNTPREMADLWINSSLSGGLVPAGVDDREPFIRALAVVLLMVSAELPARAPSRPAATARVRELPVVWTRGSK